MSCCSKIKNIAKGNVLDWVHRLFDLPGNKYVFADGRIRTCHSCEKHTWLTISEFGKWLKEQGIVNVIKHFDELEKLPELPKQGNKKSAKLMCMICKCFIPAKAYSVDDENEIENEKKHCPLGKW